MARKIQMTKDEILRVLDAMHTVCVYPDPDGFLRVTCSLCDHNLFVGFEGSDPETGHAIYDNDLGADELFIRAAEHALPDDTGLSECDSMRAIGEQIDDIASAAHIDFGGGRQ